MEVSHQSCVPRYCFGTRAAHAAPDSVSERSAEQQLDAPGNGLHPSCRRENETCADDICVR